MAGLLTNAQLDDAADREGRVQPSPQEQEPTRDTMELGEKTLADDEPNALPEEQEQYERFVKNGYLMIYAEQGEARPQIIQLLDPDPSDIKAELPPEALEKMGQQFSPVTALAATTVRLVLQLVTGAKEAGVEMSGDVILQGGKAILEDLVMVSEGEKMHDFSQEEIDQAMVLAAAMYYAAAKARDWIDDEPLRQEYQQIEEAANRDGPGAVPSLFGIRSRQP